MGKRERILWVCQNERAPDHPKGSCGQAGGVAVKDALKAGIVRRGLRHRVRVCGSSCLDLCWQRTAIAVEPDHVFYGAVTAEDVDEILESLESGTIVERLRVPEDGFEDPDAVPAPAKK